MSIPLLFGFFMSLQPPFLPASSVPTENVSPLSSSIGWGHERWCKFKSSVSHDPGRNIYTYRYQIANESDRNVFIQWQAINVVDNVIGASGPTIFPRLVQFKPRQAREFTFETNQSPAFVATHALAFSLPDSPDSADGHKRSERSVSSEESVWEMAFASLTGIYAPLNYVAALAHDHACFFSEPEKK